MMPRGLHLILFTKWQRKHFRGKKKRKKNGKGKKLENKKKEIFSVVIIKFCMYRGVLIQDERNQTLGCDIHWSYGW